MKKTIFISLALLFITDSVFTQNYFHKKYTVKNGLSQSQVYTLHQDKKGFIWIGTVGGGINIFNGKEFKTYTTENGLNGNMILSIFEDNKNNIWIGSDNGINVYDGKDFSKSYTSHDNTPIRYVYCISQRTNGDFLFGTGKGVLILKNGEIKKLEGNDNLSNTTVFSIKQDQEGSLWFGTRNKGAIEYTNEGEFIEYNTSNGLNSNQIWSISVDENNKKWLCTGDGVNTIKNKEVESLFSKSTFINSYINDSGDKYFINYNGHLIIIKNNNDTLRYYFKQSKFRKVIVDKENNIWLGSEEGLIKFPPNKFINYDESDGLHNNIIYTICEDRDGNCWLGATSGGISKMVVNKYNKVKFQNYHLQDENHSIPGNSVYDIITDNSGKLWIATWGGISVYNPFSDKFINYTPDTSIAEDFNNTHLEPEISSKIINKLYLDKNNIIWIGTNEGVSKYENDYFKAVENNISERKIYDILQSSKNNKMYFASDNGLYMLDGNKFISFDKEKILINGMVLAITEDYKKNIWIATKKGIYQYDGESFKNFSKENGLSSNNIYLLEYDNKNLYIGSNLGIDIMNLEQLYQSNSIEIKNYGELEGFMGQECNLNAFFKDSKNRLWFGTVGGATIYIPENDKPNDTPPETFITNLKLDFKDFDWKGYCDSVNKETGLPVNLALPHNMNHLTFSFIATSLTIPEKVRYKYMIEGLDKDWSPALKKNEADYPSLPPGKYTFKVIACNNDGLWSENPTEFKFEIKPPFWQTTWFITSSVIFVLIIIYIIIKIREANLKKEKKILEDKVQERTQEIRKQKDIVEQKNKDITDSINYARNIQEALLPSKSVFSDMFKDAFIFYEPRDIVSGDFYWMAHKNDKLYFAAADCTGHGVPGAFMSMLGITFLHEIVNTNADADAGKILDLLRYNVIAALHQSGKEGEQKDGMDISLAVMNESKTKMQFAGANNPVYIIRNNELIEHKGDKMPIGHHVKQDDFKNNIIDVQIGDNIYLFSDGYPDQFGGEKNKKFKYKNLKKLFLSFAEKPMKNQYTELRDTLIGWKGNLEQLDDILVIGVKI